MQLDQGSMTYLRSILLNCPVCHYISVYVFRLFLYQFISASINPSFFQQKKYPSINGWIPILWMIAMTYMFQIYRTVYLAA